MEWYMFIIYGVLIMGAISSYRNFKLQEKWYKKTHLEDVPYKTEPSVSERKL